MYILPALAFIAGVQAVRQADQQIPLGAGSSASGGKYSVQTPPLDTDWTYKVGTNPWPEYPRPKLARSQWQSLNGIWTYSDAGNGDALKSPPFNKTLSQEVLVPFCLESGLSGIQGKDTIYSWYQTTFSVPSKWTGDRVLLNFGAVDYEATVFVNGQKAAFNRGGYFAFSVDVTDYLNGGQNELVVFAFDPTDGEKYVIPVGKQTLKPSHIFYRPCSGIWQSVWIESAPSDYISDLSLDADASGNVNLTAESVKGSKSRVEVSVLERGSKTAVATYSGSAGSPITFKVPSPKKWSPDSPSLYDFTIEFGKDTVSSYTGFRTVTRKVVNNVQRVLLNGEVIFPFGTLDQGYWPDGLYTPPSYEAMAYDIKALKTIGYNMLRKHVKIESALYYAAADELGILIMQDMPCLRPSEIPDDGQQKEFERQLELMVKQFKGYSSIFSWVLYNEGWGQRTSTNPEFAITERVHQLDPTRPVNAISGWHDHGAGDFHDNHHYASPECGTPWSLSNKLASDSSRVAIQGEFGGIGHNVTEDHLWKVKQAIDQIEETYELWETLDEWNTRGKFLLSELLLQVELYACAGGVWTQTTDVEGEINGMLTYDRRILRTDVKQWKADIQALYDASAARAKNAL